MRGGTLSDPYDPLQDQEVVRRLVDDGMVLFVAIDDAGNIGWIGDSARNILGRDPADLVGTPALDILHPDDHALVVDTLAETARNAEDRILAVVRLAHRNGTWIRMEFGGLDLRDDDGSGHFLVWGRVYESTGRLLEFLGSLLAGGDTARMLDGVVRWSDTLAPHGQTVILVPDAGAYRALAASDGLPPPLGAELCVRPGDPGPWAAALAQGTAEHREITCLGPELQPVAAEAGMQAVWCVPVSDPSSEPPAALLVLWRDRPAPIAATHRRHLEEVAKLARLALEWSATHGDLLFAATTDPLTGIANRAQLGAAMRDDRSERAAVLFCDLDDFKAVNDRHGHQVGDLILQAVAARMAGTIRVEDLLVRLGGDEFAVWCPGLASRQEAEEIADRLVEVLNQPIVVDGSTHAVGCSIGLAVVEGAHDTDERIDRILGRADRAVYRAKHSGKGRWADLDG